MSEVRWPGPLSAAVAQLCHRLIPQLGPHSAAGLNDVLRRLSAPLQVAVVGRLSSGKSTLVNALIGRRVAPTDIGECTRLVTRFQYGTVDRVEVVTADGARRALPFEPDGSIPADPATAAGVNPGAVSHLEAYLTNAVLRELTVIDTPGLGSLDAVSVARTEALLGARPAPAPVDEHERTAVLDRVSFSAVAGAEAVLYVVTQSVRADDRQVLATFTAATASRDAGPLNALAVLNKADTIAPESVPGSDGDLWRAATLLATSQARVLRPRVAEVLPVIGLLAETAETGRFTAADAVALGALAALDPPLREAMLLSADLFVGDQLFDGDPPVQAGVRVRLLELLDLHGVGRALAAIDADPAISAGALRRVLLAESGLAAVQERLDGVFRARADGIKAAAALASVTELARQSGDQRERRCVHDGIEALLQKPEAHQLRLLEALTLVVSGAVDMPPDLLDEVVRVGGSTDPIAQLGLPDADLAGLTAHALERAGWWRSFASFGATPAQSRVAHVVHRAYFLLWQRLRDDHGAPRG